MLYAIQTHYPIGGNSRLISAKPMKILWYAKWVMYVYLGFCLTTQVANFSH